MAGSIREALTVAGADVVCAFDERLLPDLLAPHGPVEEQRHEVLQLRVGHRREDRPSISSFVYIRSLGLASCSVRSPTRPLV